MQESPILIAPPPSPIRRAPCMIRLPCPITTSPHTVASGATQAVPSICGCLAACAIIMAVSPLQVRNAALVIGRAGLGRRRDQHTAAAFRSGIGCEPRIDEDRG